MSFTVSDAAKAAEFLIKCMGFRQKYKADGFAYVVNTSIEFPIIFLTAGSNVLEGIVRNDKAQGVVLEFVVAGMTAEHSRLSKITEVSAITGSFFDFYYENIVYRVKQSNNPNPVLNFNKNRVLIEQTNLILNVKDVKRSLDFAVKNFGYETIDNAVTINITSGKEHTITFVCSPNKEYVAGIIIANIVEDIKAELEIIVKKGTPVFHELQTDPWGEMLFEIMDDNGVLYQPVEWAKPEDTQYLNNSPHLSSNRHISYESQTYESDDVNFIEIIGAKENNLKNINVKIPKRKITVFTGVSGSGKSSIVFDTLAQESGRQLNETYPSITRRFLPKYRQPNADAILNISPAIVIDQKRIGGNSRSTVGTITEINTILRVFFSRFAYPKLGFANQYSFNDPNGMCPACEGIGKINTLNIELALDKDKTLNEGAILLPGFNAGGWLWQLYANEFDPDKKIKDFTEEELNRFLYAHERSSTKAHGISRTFEGLVLKFNRQNFKTENEKSETTMKRMEKFITAGQCAGCKGKRYNEKVLQSKLAGYSIHDLCEMQVDELIDVLKAFKIPAAFSAIKNLIDRLQGLCDIGLEYVTLNRETTTLSGGESQRIKMVKHLSSSLTDVMYIFDEPSIGLHPRDVNRLNEMLVKIRDKGNTVIVVEHDLDVIRIADHVIDVGLKAGRDGGNIVFSGTLDGLKNAGTITAKSISLNSPLKATTREPGAFYESSKSMLNNLKYAGLRVPQNVFTVVTGVAGSGKSTLVNQVFAKEFPNVVCIDQSSVFTTSRASPATYLNIADEIRKIFAKANKVKDSLFSANSEGGCQNCKGSGFVEINLSFMDVMELECEVCGGARFKQEVLQYCFNGKNILDVMNMTASEAIEFFESKTIKNKLQNLIDVGLGYITTGQPLSTLSGGESQRLKLAAELMANGNIYIMDEPTTGLHISDIKNIIAIIDKLIERGNTVVVIEHNLEIIKRADWIVDMGIDGGNRGGEIIFEGTPKDLLDCDESITAKYLKVSIDSPIADNNMEILSKA